MDQFQDRTSAGRLLANELVRMNLQDPVVLALPRGGIPVGLEIAKALQAPLDLILIRKIGLPSQPELAAAAVVDGERADLVINEQVMTWSGLSLETLHSLAERELKEIERRRRIYLSNRAPISVKGRTAIVVDDGIATGTTVRAALKALAKRGTKQIVLAVPVAAVDEIASLREQVASVVCLIPARAFLGISSFYEDFHQLKDAEVIHLLQEAPCSSVTGQASPRSDGKPEPSADDVARPQRQ